MFIVTLFLEYIITYYDKFSNIVNTLFAWVVLLYQRVAPVGVHIGASLAPVGLLLPGWSQFWGQRINQEMPHSGHTLRVVSEVGRPLPVPGV